MNRTRFLLLLVAVLIVGNIAYRVWADWGLITIHATEQPLEAVIRAVEKKGGIQIRSNIDPGKKITMHVVKARLPYVLEVLANVTEARWQVSYLLAPAKPEIDQAVAAFTNGEKPEGWKNWHIDLPRGAFGNPDEPSSDPRKDRWEMKTAPEGTLHAYLAQGSASVDARFAAPEAWNPAVSSAPKPGPLGKVVPQLAKAAGGKYEEVVLLLGRRRDDRGPGPDGGPDGGGFRRMFGDGRENRGAEGGGNPDDAGRMQAVEQRIEAEIARMPAAQQAQARQEQAERKSFFESMKDLSPEERRAKMEARMSDPATADRFMAGMAKRDAMKTPEQRLDRYRSYVNNKQSATKSN